MLASRLRDRITFPFILAALFSFFLVLSLSMPVSGLVQYQENFTTGNFTGNYPSAAICPISPTNYDSYVFFDVHLFPTLYKACQDYGYEIYNNVGSIEFCPVDDGNRNTLRGELLVFNASENGYSGLFERNDSYFLWWVRQDSYSSDNTRLELDFLNLTSGVQSVLYPMDTYPGSLEGLGTADEEGKTYSIFRFKKSAWYNDSTMMLTGFKFYRNFYDNAHTYTECQVFTELGYVEIGNDYINPATNRVPSANLTGDALVKYSQTDEEEACSFNLTLEASDYESNPLYYASQLLTFSMPSRFYSFDNQERGPLGLLLKNGDFSLLNNGRIRSWCPLSVDYNESNHFMYQYVVDSGVLGWLPWTLIVNPFCVPVTGDDTSLYFDLSPDMTSSITAPDVEFYVYDLMSYGISSFNVSLLDARYDEIERYRFSKEEKGNRSVIEYWDADTGTWFLVQNNSAPTGYPRTHPFWNVELSHQPSVHPLVFVRPSAAYKHGVLWQLQRDSQPPDDSVFNTTGDVTYVLSSYPSPVNASRYLRISPEPYSPEMLAFVQVAGQTTALDWLSLTSPKNFAVSVPSSSIATISFYVTDSVHKSYALDPSVPSFSSSSVVVSAGLSCMPHEMDPGTYTGNTGVPGTNVDNYCTSAFTCWLPVRIFLTITQGPRDYARGFGIISIYEKFYWLLVIIVFCLLFGPAFHFTRFNVAGILSFIFGLFYCLAWQLPTSYFLVSLVGICLFAVTFLLPVFVPAIGGGHNTDPGTNRGGGGN